MILPRHLFFDHGRHTLQARNVGATLDVQSLTVEGQLSKPFSYRIEFTCTEQDLSADLAHLANDGLQHHNTSPDARIKQPVAHTDHRHLYASLLGRLNTQEETAP